MIASAAILAARALVAGLLVVDERMGARVLAPPPLHHGCALSVGEER